VGYEFTVMPAPTHLHIRATGDNTRESLNRFLIDAYRAAVTRNCDSVLLELNLSGESLSVGSIYSIVCERSSDALRMKRIAYIDTNSAHVPDRAEFAELAASRLGVNARLFRSVADAERWLKSDDNVSCSIDNAG
jgi:hypothetical protein